jgi:hypothetical protein
MEQGQYREGHFANPNPGVASSQDGQANPSVQPAQAGQVNSGGQQAQFAQAPFIPARAENGPAKQSQAKAIIILLICILAVNVATFVTQNFLSPRVMNFSGNPGFGGGGMVTQGGDAGAQQQQAPPDFGQQPEE